MRESFGGAFMIKLVLVFIVIYVSFMAVAINYAKAFRVKNRLIDYVEQYQYKSGDNRTIGKIEDYLNSIAYHIPDENGSLRRACETDAKGISNNENPYFIANGACISPRCDGDVCYYRITTYISIDFPLFKIKMTLPISGESKTLNY